MLPVVNSNLLSHKLLSLNNHRNCLSLLKASYQNFTAVGYAAAGNWNKFHLKYNKMRWEKNHKKENECLKLYVVQVSNVLQFLWQWQKLSQGKKRYWWLICFWFVCSLSFVTKAQWNHMIFPEEQHVSRVVLQ